MYMAPHRKKEGEGDDWRSKWRLTKGRKTKENLILLNSVKPPLSVAVRFTVIAIFFTTMMGKPWVIFVSGELVKINPPPAWMTTDDIVIGVWPLGAGKSRDTLQSYTSYAVKWRIWVITIALAWKMINKIKGTSRMVQEKKAGEEERNNISLGKNRKRRW